MKKITLFPFVLLIITLLAQAGYAAPPVLDLNVAVQIYTEMGTTASEVEAGESIYLTISYTPPSELGVPLKAFRNKKIVFNYRLAGAIEHQYTTTLDITPENLSTSSNTILFTVPEIVSESQFVFFGHVQLTRTLCTSNKAADHFAIADKEVPETDYTNSIGMTFNLIPAGTFMMGSPPDELGRYSDEPLHMVTLSEDFYMQRTEVTQGQWQAVMGSNPSFFSNCGADCPVEEVSWDMVQDFIDKLNTLGEGVYGLPTEAQWEYAARSGSTTAFANGDIVDTSVDSVLDQIGWYRYSSNSANYANGTKPVAMKIPNNWGLYDMHGNVSEWVSDYYDYDSYGTLPVIDPTGPTSGYFHVKRGGNWDSEAGFCRSAERNYDYPGLGDEGLGFRLIRKK